MKYIIDGLIILLSLSACGLMLWLLAKEKPRLKAPIPWAIKIKLCLCGIVAFISDTVGIGSFAVIVAMTKYFSLMEDRWIPGTLNTAQIIPGAIEAILFLQVIHVDYLTLAVLIIGTCIGGVIGGTTVSRLNQQRTQMWMAASFVALALLILANQLNWLPISGHAVELRHWKLWAGFFGMIVCGFLPALGVGLFAVVEVLLFLLGLSPLIAFPIMTTAGALQQPLTGISFLLNKRVPIRKTLILSVAGTIGVLITIPFVTHLSLVMLRWLLFAIVAYNAVMLLRSFIRSNTKTTPKDLLVHPQ